ncbi:MULTISPECIES: hypothetical protein [unclassified Enterococcus]|uniref:hypothetical protein n=1 Tax=unclassified Enterococcus TaxID=2608891 RepID=UPI001555350A|nr:MULTISPECIES: hypothetical protein [unclassified Enterococcus]MBS7578119.1 hypothetical protein [Enterococcus sp. MMGLQ5-2]MBS7585379.1 hypothetical protein [Enterococcus sp. MMGLQ5-1]NPD13236.1 hypothetical protein [Enterococcus sp. MMGLQ5-1]NPD37950.1 hypothetical protein [Enterococcus sp. MMGLQ5-2]
MKNKNKTIRIIKALTIGNAVRLVIIIINCYILYYYWAAEHLTLIGLAGKIAIVSAIISLIFICFAILLVPKHQGKRRKKR